MQTGLLAGAGSLGVIAAGFAYREPLQAIVKSSLSWHGLLYSGGVLVTLSFSFTLYWFCKTHYFEMPDLQARLSELTAEKDQLEMDLQADRNEIAIYHRLAREQEVN